MAMESIDDIITVHKVAGGNWFDFDEMKYWGTQAHDHVVSEGEKGSYFISSEPDFYGEDRRFTVRYCTMKGKISTVGEFRAYATEREAKDAIASLMV